MTGQDLFLLCVISIVCIPGIASDQDELDITTIFRFDKADVMPHYDINLYDTSDLIESYYSLDGWSSTSTVMMNVTFPTDEYTVLTTGESGNTDIISMKVPFTLTIHRNDLSYFDIVFMPEKKPDVGTLVIYRLTDRRLIVFSCVYGLGGVPHHILGKERRCYEILDKTVSWTLEASSIFLFKDSTISSPTARTDEIFSIPTSIAHCTHFIVSSHRNSAEFILRKPEPILALAKSTAYLTTCVFRGTPTCLSLYYYMDPESGGEIKLYARQRNEKVIIDQITSQDKQSAWKIHRIMYVPEISDKYDIFIEAKKTSDARVLIHGLKTCSERDTWDSTTFVKSGSVSMHARTNALGRPFILQNGTIVNPITQNDIPVCPNSNWKCDWASHNWNLLTERTYFMEYAPLPQWFETSIAINISEGEMSPLYHFHGSFISSFTTEVYDGDMQVRLYIQEYEELNDGQYFIVRIRDNQIAIFNHERAYQECWVPGDSNVQCGEICSAGGNFNWKSDSVYKISVTLTDHMIQASINDHISEMTCKTTGIFKPMRFLGIGTNDLTMTIPFSGKRNYALNLEKEEGYLLSPPIIPSSNKLCVSVLYHMTKGTLTLSAELSNGTSIHLEDFSKMNEWTYHPVVKEISQLPMRLILHATKENTGHVVIQRIAGCHPEEDTVDLGWEQTLTVINPMSTKGKKKYISSDLCVNGGVYNEHGHCSCPPGFIGDSCEQGCGENWFGNDCMGRCSNSSRGCAGMYLCKSSWGCSCATGYTGFFCSEACDSDKYGADCKQTCGHCNTRTCDRFTGKCFEGCQEGYYPPLCQQKTSYMVTAPKVQAVNHKVYISLNFSKENIKGEGTPLYYQIQYTENLLSPWTSLYSDEIDSETYILNISEPSYADKYLLRVVLINDDGSTYQESTIPIAEVKKDCAIPDAEGYQLEILDIEERSFVVHWQPLDKSEDLCEISGYEVFVNDGFKWSTYAVTTSNSLIISQSWPVNNYQVRLRAVTLLGNVTSFSKPAVVVTNTLPLTAVQNLRVVSSNSTLVVLKWNYPYPVNYFSIEYQCTKLVSCPGSSCDDTVHNYEINDTTATLQNLSPLAQYRIAVTAITEDISSQVSVIKVLTSPAGSEAAPVEVKDPISDLTNTSFTVKWAPPLDCSKLNGFPQGYWYRLRLLGQNTELSAGNTLQTRATFENLTPHTSYEVDVFLKTNGGWDENHGLTITVKTRMSAPGRVIELTAYKRSRREIGLRWGAPAQTYGALESFTITYLQTSLPHSHLHQVISPTPCSAWPELYCASVKKLRPDTEYSFTIKARNVDISEDGEPSTVLAVTKEGSPVTPSYIHLLSQSSTSLAIQWGIPSLLNGVLRSFLVSVEEINFYNTSDCCQYFPFQEVAVHGEKEFYMLEIGGLRSAATYTISVSGKTGALGPPAYITAHTKPPLPILPVEPRLEIDQVQLEVRLQLVPITELKELARAYLLLLVPLDQEKEIPEPVILDNTLAEEIKNTVNSSFYIVGEYSPEHLTRDETIYLHQSRLSFGGILCKISQPELTGETYHLVFIAVLEYEGIYSIGITESQSFSIPWLLDEI